MAFVVMLKFPKVPLLWDFLGLFPVEVKGKAVHRRFMPFNLTGCRTRGKPMKDRSPFCCVVLSEWLWGRVQGVRDYRNFTGTVAGKLVTVKHPVTSVVL